MGKKKTPQPPPLHPLSQLIGLHQDDPRVTKFTASLGKAVAGGSPPFRSRHFLQSGVSITTLKEKIDNVTLYASGVEKHEGFKGTLPAGLTFASDRENVRKAYGKPTQSFDDGDRYDCGVLSTVFDYAVDLKSLRSITYSQILDK